MKLNRNQLKIIAAIAMLLDHVGKIFLPHVLVLQVVGRIAFPIFAFFIAEGMRYTKNKKRYLINMSVFACVSQVPYMLLFGARLNILFTFLLALGLIEMLEYVKKNNFGQSGYVTFAITIIIALLLTLVMPFDYGFVGVLLVILLYYLKNTNHRYIAICGCMLFLSLQLMLFGVMTFGLMQLASIFAIPLLMVYDGSAGNKNLKYFFYLFYPLHMFVIYILNMIF